eukprot:gene8849-9028_t
MSMRATLALAVFLFARLELTKMAPVATRANQKADICPPNTYSPGFSRLRACFKCQSGMTEPSSFNSTTLRISKTEVCGVPAGRYLSQNVVRDCPLGSFRSTWELAVDVSARYCYPCPPGITTSTAAATTFAACNVAQPGYDVNWQDDVTNMESQVTTDGNGTLSDPSNYPPACPIGTYYEGGVISSSTTSTCKPCPLGTTTQSNGSTSADECMVPPGYYIKLSGSSGSLEKCPINVTAGGVTQGYFRAGWKTYLDLTVRESGSGTTACTPCGENIVSALTDIDEMNSGDDPTKLVAGSPASCYIEAGWGMTPVPLQINQWRANLCANNSYGVENRTYGLQQSPCKPCQRNTITLRAGATNYTECINPAGFGFSSDGVTQCPKGFWTFRGSMSPCTPCPVGRTTEFDPAHPEYQDSPNDCFVEPGKGVFNSSFNVTPNNNASDYNLSVLDCPVGSYSNGGSLSTVCSLCTTGYSTVDEGTVGTNNSACTVCAAGYGLPRNVSAIQEAGSCEECGYNTYQVGYNGVSGLNVVGDGRSCGPCSRTNFTYVGSRGRKARYESAGITFYKKSVGPEACVPRYVQLMIDAGQLYSLPDSAYTSVSAASAQDCLDSCKAESDAGKGCFVQLDYTNTTHNTEQATCKKLVMVPATASVTTSVLLMKMMPSDPIAAASVDDESVKAKAMASGLYSRFQVPASITDLTTVGQQLASGTNEKDCRIKCDMNSLCWGVLLDAAGACTLRTGADSLDTRSFFYNPDPAVVDLQTLFW